MPKFGLPPRTRNPFKYKVDNPWDYQAPSQAPRNYGELSTRIRSLSRGNRSNPLGQGLENISKILDIVKKVNG